MKISILLPYKENFSPTYPGAVSLFVYETSKKSIFKKNIIVYGSTKLKKKFPIKYNNISLINIYYPSVDIIAGPNIVDTYIVSIVKNIVPAVQRIIF